MTTGRRRARSRRRRPRHRSPSAASDQTSQQQENSMTSVIVAGARTPIGKLLGGLTPLTAADLGGHVISAAVTRAGIPSAEFDAVYFGNVVQAGAGPNPARLSAVNGDVPLTVPATTINKLCLSGLTALGHADLAI